ncbi:MAG: DUF2474 domain-containing protein [Methylotenera sp.]|nr:DUF2474 domain-containing protein [Methylotenera sp.]MDI1309867.1 DUF2474 domain-containing protein [Methylotenera sp.]
MIESEKKPRWIKRIAWLILIWGVSVLALLIVTVFLKLIMNALGLIT